MLKIEYQSVALFLLRLLLGYIYLFHGLYKFGLFGGQNLEGFVGWSGGFGIGPFWAYFGAFGEVIGSLMLLMGIAAEIGALINIPIMIAAAFWFHWHQGFFVGCQGFEYAFNLILFNLIAIIGGPGKFAIWDPFIKLRDRLEI